MIDVVIPTHNGRERLPSCLAHLRDQDVEHRVILIDDGSTDGSPGDVGALHPAVEVTSLPERSGFPRAANTGMRAATSEIVVLLNDDVDVRPGFLRALARPFADPRVGMAAAVMLRADGRTLEGLGIEADRTLAGYSRFWGADPASLESLHDEHLIGPSGGAAAYRKEALERVGYLDEGIAGYQEDLDLALRIQTAGWRCAGARDAVCRHLGGMTYGRRSGWQLWAKGFSRTYTLRKYGVLRRPHAAAQALASELATVVWQLARDRRTDGLRGRVEGWRAGRDAVRHDTDPSLVNPSIGLREGYRRRRAYGA